MATPVDPEGSPEISLLARLVEDVANLSEALSVSRILEDRLSVQVTTLEAMVATLRILLICPQFLLPVGSLKK
jgi:hypothetical protein